MRALLPLALLAAGCVEIHRGATVAMNLEEAAAAGPEEHYQLYAVVNGGPVALQRFKVLSPIRDCGASPALVPDIQVVQAYDVGVSREALCQPERRLGAIDKIDFATAANVGGIRVATEVDLSDATSVFVTVEADGDTDPRPGRVWLTAELGDGLAPDAPVYLECLSEYCDGLDRADPAQALDFETFCRVPRTRRGVRVGTFLEVPYDDVCLAVRPGRIAVVPAQDETDL